MKPYKVSAFAIADYRPGLSAGVSGTAYADNVSVSSALSSCPGTEEPLPMQQARAAQTEATQRFLFEYRFAYVYIRI